MKNEPRNYDECRTALKEAQKRAEKAERERDELARELEEERYHRRAVQESEQALSAHVERLREFIKPMYLVHGAVQLLAETPAASLAAHDAALLKGEARDLMAQYDCDYMLNADQVYSLFRERADAIERGDA